jgi:hypothetical protein
MDYEIKKTSDGKYYLTYQNAAYRFNVLSGDKRKLFDTYNDALLYVGSEHENEF